MSFSFFKHSFFFSFPLLEQSLFFLLPQLGGLLSFKARVYWLLLVLVEDVHDLAPEAGLGHDLLLNLSVARHWESAHTRDQRGLIVLSGADGILAEQVCMGGLLVFVVVLVLSHFCFFPHDLFFPLLFNYFSFLKLNLGLCPWGRN